MNPVKKLLLGAIVFFISNIGWATTYYVSTSGNDSASGRSPTQAVKTVTKGFSKLSNGDSLLFRQGDTWQVHNYIMVKRSNVIIGSFPGGKGSARPVLDMGNRKSNSYNGLITIKANGVKVQGLHIKSSGGIGIDYYRVANGTVENVKIEKSFRHGVRFFESKNMVVRGSEVVNHNIGWTLTKLPTWASGLVSLGSQDVLIENNIVREGWGEGINAFYGSQRVVIQDNKLYANRAVGIYVDSSRDITIQRNTVLGTSDRRYYRGANGVGAGIALNNERFEFKAHGGRLDNNAVTQNIKIFNNLVAGSMSGVSIWSQFQRSHYRNIKISNNIFVDNEGQLEITSQKIQGSNNTISNNIFLSISANTKDILSPSGTKSFVFQQNSWSVTPRPHWNVAGSGDVIGGVRLGKMSGWRSIQAIGGDWVGRFTPTSSSKSKASGRKLGSSTASTDFLLRKITSSRPDIGAFAGAGGVVAPKPLAAPEAPANVNVK